MQEILQQINKICEARPYKIIFSRPRADAEYKKITFILKQAGYHIEKFTQTQAYHQNINIIDLYDCLSEYAKHYMQINAFDSQFEHILLISKKMSFTYKKIANININVPAESNNHNRKKHYLIQEGDIFPPLIEMGVMTRDGRVINSMRDKFKQINRFIEIIDDGIKQLNKNTISIIDFGCGKSYLTFVLYAYLTEYKKIKTHMVGLDLKKDVIQKCNDLAQKYNYNNLAFQWGDIKDYVSDRPTDIVISLHACDTATDYALYNAIQWQAKLIYAVPCCQHELNHQINSNQFNILTKYGIIKERSAALMTDAIRANLLEASGYSAQLLEFIDFAHTPKNILIRAYKQPISEAKKQKALSEVSSLMKAFGLMPMLYHLLYERNSQK